MSRIRTQATREQSDLARQVVASTRRLATELALQEVELVDVQFTSGTTVALAHGLGRAWRSWCVARPRGTGWGNLIEASHTDAERERVLKLTPNATFVANIRIR